MLLASKTVATYMYQVMFEISTHFGYLLIKENSKLFKKDQNIFQLLCTVCMYFPYFPGWLDDIGLPQYKDSFSDGSVDGRMLNYLTFVSSEDLCLDNGFS